MAFFGRFPHLIRDGFVPALAVLAVGYFTYHTIEGRHGLIAYARLNREIVALESEKTRLEAEKTTLEQRVARLKPGAVDRDMLEEEVRRKLGYVGRGDLIYQPSR